MTVHRRVPLDLAGDGASVRVEQQLRGIAPLPGRRIPRSVDPKAVALAGLDAGQVALPHERITLLEIEPRLPARVVEQAHLDRISDAREQAEARAAAVVASTQRRSRGGLDPAACRP